MAKKATVAMDTFSLRVDGRITGTESYDVRRAVIAHLKAMGLLVDVVSYAEHGTGVGDVEARPDPVPAVRARKKR